MLKTFSAIEVLSTLLITQVQEDLISLKSNYLLLELIISIKSSIKLLLKTFSTINIKHVIIVKILFLLKSLIESIFIFILESRRLLL